MSSTTENPKPSLLELYGARPAPGRLAWIGASSERLSPIRVLDSARIEAGTGMVDDYHAKSGRSRRQVTLIQEEHLGAVARLLGREAIDPRDLRRNLVVAGINLIALKGRRFRVGEVVMEGTGPCAPCKRMEQNLGPGGLAAMLGHGGITAIVLESGTVRPGDTVEILGES